MLTILTIIITFLVLISPVRAQEDWCTNPTTAPYCVCSEPLTSATYTKYGNDYYKGNDANSKPCAMDGLTGYGVRSNDIWRLQVYSDVATLNKLPNRNVAKTPRFLGEPSGATGDFMVGITDPNLANKKRVALRFYLWRDANFIMSGATCGNTKELGARPGWAISSYVDNYWAHLYNTVYFTWSGHPPNVFDGFEPSGGNAGPFGTGSYSTNSFKDSWTRLEMIVINPSGPGHDLELYAKNITNGGDEQQAIRLSAGCDRCGFENGVAYSPFTWDNSFTPNSPIIEYIAMLYKAIEAGTSCPGIQGALYLTVAAWDTNAGQRIGAAIEVEGGSGGPTYPIATINAFLRSFIPIIIVIGVGSLSMICMIMGISRWWQRRVYAPAHFGDTDDHRDPGGESLEPASVVGPRPQGGHDIQPVVPVSPTDELVGVGAEMESAGRKTEKPR